MMIIAHMTIVMNDYTFPWIPLISKSPRGWAVQQNTFHAFTLRGSVLVAVSIKLDSSFCLVWDEKVLKKFYNEYIQCKH